MQELVLQVQHGELLAHALEELHRIELGLAAALALRIQRGAQEIRVVDARNLDRILEREEHAFGGALLGFEVEQVAAAIGRPSLR